MHPAQETIMRTGMLAVAIVVLAVTPAVSAEPEADEAVPETDAQFFAEVGYKAVATASDTARALVILVSEGKELGGDYDACRAYLRERGILPDGWLQDAAPDEPTTKGNLARLIAKALSLEGGLWMRLFGPLPRIALNECAYLDIMTRGAVYRHVMGGELVGVIDRADRFRAMGSPAEVPKLEGEPSGAKEGAS
jgi:hypothetical protein